MLVIGRSMCVENRVGNREPDPSAIRGVEIALCMGIDLRDACLIGRRWGPVWIGVCLPFWETLGRPESLSVTRKLILA